MRTIKRVSVLMAFMALISLNLTAQLRLGIKGGLNSSTVTNSPYTGATLTVDGLDYKPSYHFGVAVQYMMQEFGLESGVYYTSLGGNASVKQGAFEYEVSTNPTYLQLPIMMLYKFQLNKKTFLYPSFGMFFSYGISGTTKQDGYLNGQTIESSEEDYFNDQTNRFDWGPCAGLNLEYNKFVVGLGYEYGAKRVNKEKNDDDGNGHNHDFKLSLGYFF